MDENRCAQCGTATSPGAKYCESCGAPIAAQGMQPPAQGPPVYQAPAYYTGAPTPYQGVAIRFVAILIDYVIIGIIVGIIALPFGVAAIAVTANAGNMSALSWGSIALASLIGLAIWFLYFTLLEGRYGQTIGKMALNIKGSARRRWHADRLRRSGGAVPFFVSSTACSIILLGRSLSGHQIRSSDLETASHTP